MNQGNEEAKVLAREFNAVKPKVFNSQSIGLLMIAELEKRWSNTAMCEYKIGSGSDGNLMPINMFKVLFLNTTIVDFNKSIDIKVVLHTYNNLHLPEICKNSKN